MGALLISRPLVESKFMVVFLKDSNKGNPIQGDPYAFKCFGNVSHPLMATLNLIGSTMGLLVWLFSTLIVLNYPHASKIRTSYQDHQTNVDPLLYFPMKSSPPSSPSSGDSVVLLVAYSLKRRRGRVRRISEYNGEKN